MQLSQLRIHNNFNEPLQYDSLSKMWSDTSTRFKTRTWQIGTTIMEKKLASDGRPLCFRCLELGKKNPNIGFIVAYIKGIGTRPICGDCKREMEKTLE